MKNTWFTVKLCPCKIEFCPFFTWNRIYYKIFYKSFLIHIIFYISFLFLGKKISNVFYIPDIHSLCMNQYKWSKNLLHKIYFWLFMETHWFIIFYIKKRFQIFLEFFKNDSMFTPRDDIICKIVSPKEDLLLWILWNICIRRDVL